mgnify:FL=1
MKAKIRAHDGIVGLLHGTSVVLTLQVGIEWVYLAGAVAVL